MSVSNPSIYVLKLENDKYYVGKTNNVPKRYRQHIDGTGSSWTQKYKPIHIEKTIELKSPFDEDKIVKEYMSQYGINNVRGGTYVTDTLTQSQLDSLKAEIWGASDLCNKCGRENHFFKDCYAKNDKEGNVIIAPKTNISKLELIKLTMEVAITAAVTAAMNSAMKILLDEGHTKVRKTIQIKKKATVNPEIKPPPPQLCYRCGRPGHYSTECYAKTHANGTEI
jgi:predicted GIY-YIG superfamily endonuclease